MASSYDMGQTASWPGAHDAVPRRHRDSRPEGGTGRSLAGLIESEIIPRLMVAHPVERVAEDAGGGIRQDEIDTLAALVTGAPADVVLAFVERLLARGIAVETVLVDLLAPAARALGDGWSEDRVDFVEVTMGLWRLQEVVQDLADRSPVARVVRGARRALFAAMPGDQHGFGAIVIQEVFAREGWATDRITAPRTADLVERVAGEWFDLVGLTVSCDAHTGGVSSVIAAMRSVSRNPRLRVMVGGRVFVEDPALAARVGADGTARDALVAAGVAAELVAAAEREALLPA
jgi:MerR family transcriptional regulator, light-induced transcriptional regulator